MKSKYRFLLICLLNVPFQIWAQQVSGLRCNYATSPTCIDDLYPRLSWQINAQKRGSMQTAYQIMVSSSLPLLKLARGNVWNSGKKKNANSQYIPYAGQALLSGKVYYWKVRVWDNHGKMSPWSAVGHWRMCLLKVADWQSQWITASRWFTPPELRPKGFQLSNKGGWADVDLGQTTSVQLIKLYPSDSASFPKRFNILGSNEFNFVHSAVLVDQSSSDVIMHGTANISFVCQPASFRFIRLQILPSAKSSTVRQMEIYSGSENVALMKFTREYGTAWDHGHAPFLVDGMPSQNDGDTCPANACPSGAAPEFRKKFNIRKNVISATVYYAALEMADITFNGRKVTDEVLGPPFTDYTKRIMYVSYDVTNLLKKGCNVIGAVLGNGFFSTPKLGFGQRHNGNGPPAFILQTLINYADGTKERIATDGSWKWARSEITFNDVWEGYSENRHLLKSGWTLPEYDDSQWATVSTVRKPTGTMTARIGPPNKINGIIKPIRVENNHAYFETASVGWPLLKVNGKPGQKITISGGGPGYKMAKLDFLLSEDGPASLSPNLIIQPGPVDMIVEGLNEPLKPEDICIQYVNSDLRETSAFTCSNPYLNKLYEVTMQTHRNYINDFPADPNREKQGWTQDVQNMFNTAAYLTDSRALYRRWWNDMADNQDEQGYLGSVVPMVNRQVYDWNSPWWSGMIVLLPWEHYLHYGNDEILRNAYPAMRRYVDFLEKVAATGEGENWDDYAYFTQNLDTVAAKEKMIIWNGAGDWNNPFRSDQHAVPTPMTTMPAWYHYTRILSQIAKLVGNEKDVLKYAVMSTDIKQRFNRKYFHPITGLYGDSTNSQTAQILPLAVGMVPDDKVEMSYQRLIDAIHLHNDHIGAGFTSIYYLLNMLARHRESALANKMVNQKDYPSWNTLMKGGVFQENWHGGGAQMPSCGGAVGAWLIQSILGILPDAESPGFKKIILSPQPDESTGLIAADGYYDSSYGRISIQWKCLNGKFIADFTIPANTAATLIIPADDDSITESGIDIKNNHDIKLLKNRNKTAYLIVQNGKYHIETNFKL